MLICFLSQTVELFSKKISYSCKDLIIFFAFITNTKFSLIMKSFVFKITISFIPCFLTKVSYFLITHTNTSYINVLLYRCDKLCAVFAVCLNRMTIFLSFLNSKGSSKYLCGKKNISRKKAGNDSKFINAEIISIVEVVKTN